MEILRDVIRSLRNLSVLEDGDPVFPGHKTYKIDDKNFRSIEPKDSRVAFIDGGNAEILSATNFSLSFVRVYACVFDRGGKIFSRKKEFYVLTRTEFENDIIYKTDIFSDWIAFPDFNSNDPTIKEGVFLPDASKIAGIVRSFAEWKMASELASKTNDVDLIVMDGTLQTSITGESDVAETAFRNAIKNNILFTALAKTSSLLTNTGNDLLSVLKRRGSDKWLYHPIVEIDSTSHLAEMCAIKLHEHSNHAFRFEILKDQKARLSEAVSMLASNSNDYRFPGYPYGLVDADRFARVSERERIYFRSVFAAMNMENRNAHDVLNKIFR